MHTGCSGKFDNGMMVIQKLRSMGFSDNPMPQSFKLTCENCGSPFIMVTFEDQCSECGMVYGVTPCHAFDPNSIMAAGILPK